MGKHWFSAQRGELLGHGSASADALSGGDDDCGDCHDATPTRLSSDTVATGLNTQASVARRWRDRWTTDVRSEATMTRRVCDTIVTGLPGRRKCDIGGILICLARQGRVGKFRWEFALATGRGTTSSTGVSLQSDQAQIRGSTNLTIAYRMCTRHVEPTQFEGAGWASDV